MDNVEKKNEVIGFKILTSNVLHIVQATIEYDSLKDETWVQIDVLHRNSTTEDYRNKKFRLRYDTWLLLSKFVGDQIKNLENPLFSKSKTKQNKEE